MHALAQPQPWRGVAFNQATASENQIHSDAVAKQFGFRGGLVPGVTVYAYLVQPAIEAWGRDWLERGAAGIVLERPLYDGHGFRVDVDVDADSASAYAARVVDEDGTACAHGRASLPESPEEVPVFRGDPLAPPSDARPDATRATLEALRERSLGGIRLAWTGAAELDRTSRLLDDMPDLVRSDRSGYANPGFSLGVANWVLSRNVRLGPWIHTESDVQNHAPIPLGSEVVAEARITDLFERRGHEFVDLDVAVFAMRDASPIPVLRTRHRAIYRLREPG